MMGKRTGILLVAAVCLSSAALSGCGGGGGGGDSSANVWMGMHNAISYTWQYADYYVQRMRVEMDGARNITWSGWKNTFDVITTGPTASLAGTEGDVLYYDRSDGLHWTAVLDPGGDHMMLFGTDCREFAVLQRAIDSIPVYDMSAIAGSWTGQAWAYSTAAASMRPLEPAQASLAFASSYESNFLYSDPRGSRMGTINGYHYWGGSPGYMEGGGGYAGAEELLVFPTVDSDWMGGYFGNIGDGAGDPDSDAWPDGFTLFWFSRR